jgi:hypothetical protein
VVCDVLLNIQLLVHQGLLLGKKLDQGNQDHLIHHSQLVEAYLRLKPVEITQNVFHH